VNKIVAHVVSVHAGSNEDLSKEERPAILVELDGVAGDEVGVEIHETPDWLQRS
jgi:hypothetical protein